VSQLRAFQPFEMERMMSKLEKVVDYNLSESGVYPVTVRELVDDAALIEDVLTTPLDYPQANGTVELRERIAALYPGATADNVLVTVGCAEANLLALQTLLAPGDEMALMLPNYMQIWGIARNSGIEIRPFHLREERGWAPDLDELAVAVSEKTRLVGICNPNNPTGYILTGAERAAIVTAAARSGAWLLADEVYTGAERLTDVTTPSFWGMYDRVLVMGSLSKAYGLPGLRIGWAVGSADTIDELWARHEYVTISATTLSNRLAAIALSPEVRPRLLERTRFFIRRGFPILDQWLESHDGVFSLVPPQAAAIAFPRYQLDINSTHLVNRLTQEKSVLVVPGDHFGMDHFLRISFGQPPGYLQAGLDRIDELIAGLPA
jgi:aspartate/methionine/tyrosine aminotransferase